MPLKTNLVYLSLGSNLGDRSRNLQAASELVEQQIGERISRSGIYESTPWGFQSDSLFYNCCLSVRTSLEPLQLLDRILAIEASMGRIRNSGPYSDRPIDMDLLFYGDTVLDHPRLSIPHPALDRRRFVLLPLAEIAPDLVHPVSGKSVTELLEDCTDPGTVSPLD